MEFLVVVAVILLAVLTGAAVPTLIQFGSTLRSIQRFVDRVGPRLEHALDEASKTADQLHRMASELEGRAKKAKPLIDVVGDLGEGMVRLRASIRSVAIIGGALGPALGAAVRAFTARRNQIALEPPVARATVAGSGWKDFSNSRKEAHS